ncbi:SAM-dependent methyltransferase [Streptomyces carpaticus]|uniref:SAM-dependent methyltransferase n=1 Tax=Streptomyces carpaticus TaxID=285558 RepID=A0ABV4ZNG2_9ACTN
MGEDSKDVREIPAAPEIDTSVPHSARIWNYWLGGKDNYEVDRIAGDQYAATFPGIFDIARVSRYFLHRTVRHLAGEAGIRQFLDVGTGLPTEDNTHQIAQRVAPDARIVYVDNDPLVLVHAQALLTSTPRGRTDYIDADLHDPARIRRLASRTLDFSRPVAVILSDVMGHVPDDDRARSIVRNLVAELPAGSYLMLSHGATTSQEVMDAQDDYNDSGAAPYRLRTLEQISRFFDGLDLVEPGVVPMPRWRPDLGDLGPDPDGAGIGGLARLPG